MLTHNCKPWECTCTSPCNCIIFYQRWGLKKIHVYTSCFKLATTDISDSHQGKTPNWRHCITKSIYYILLVSPIRADCLLIANLPTEACSAVHSTFQASSRLFSFYLIISIFILLAAHNWRLKGSQLDNRKQCQTSSRCTHSMLVNTRILPWIIPWCWACPYFLGPL